jgi:hypothetical protein
MSLRLASGFLAGSLLLVMQYAGVHVHRHAHEADAHSHLAATLDVDHESGHEDGAVDDEASKHGSRDAPTFAVVPTETPRTTVVHGSAAPRFFRLHVEPRSTGPPRLRPPSQGPPPFALT